METTDMTTPVQLSLTIYQGATFRVPLKRSYFPYPVRDDCGQLVHDCSGKPVDEADRIPEDYSGCTARAHIRRAFGSTEIIETMTTENNGIELSGDTLTLVLTNTQTESMQYGPVPPAWTTAVSQVEVIRPNGEVERHYSISYSLDQEGTR